MSGPLHSVSAALLGEHGILGPTGVPVYNLVFTSVAARYLHASTINYAGRARLVQMDRGIKKSSNYYYSITPELSLNSIKRVNTLREPEENCEEGRVTTILPSPARLDPEGRAAKHQNPNRPQ